MCWLYRSKPPAKPYTLANVTTKMLCVPTTMVARLAQLKLAKWDDNGKAVHIHKRDGKVASAR